jgi:hypothetical protein
MVPPGSRIKPVGRSKEHGMEGSTIFERNTSAQLWIPRTLSFDAKTVTKLPMSSEMGSPGSSHENWSEISNQFIIQNCRRCHV